jgi:signal transduction histidine kinase/ligand-binding sensor domain-containing protein
MRTRGRGRLVAAPGTVLIVSLLAINSRAFALNPALDVSQYAHTTWKIRDGFPKGFVNSIAQTPDGYLWLGTEFGLVRYDGVGNVAWQPPRDQGLPDNYIRNLLAARDGTLWVGTLKGLASWNDGKLVQYKELAGWSVYALLEDREGSVWAIANTVASGKLCSIQKGGVQCFGEDSHLGQSLYEDSKGKLWVGVRGGVWQWKPGPPNFYPLPDALVEGLAEADDGTLVISAPSGIRRLVDGKIEPQGLPGTSGKFGARRLLRDREGGLWIGTAKQGLVHVHQGRTDVFTQSDGLSGDSVVALFEDREGNIWVSTYNGLDRFRDFPVPTYSGRQGLSNAIVFSVLAARDGSVWLGTSDGLKHWNHGQVTSYRERAHIRPATGGMEVTGSGLPDQGIGSIFEDGRGRVWISTRDGFGYLENDRFTYIRDLPGGIVLSIAEDTRGNLWIANQNLGLFRLSREGEIQRIPWTKLGRNDYALVLVPDPTQGGIWLGFSRDGVAYFRDSQIRASYAATDGLGEGLVNGLRLDQDGTLWAATQGGLSRLKNGRVTTLTSKNGLPCDAVNWVTEDDFHSFWLYTACGLVRIARSELDAWAAHPNHSVQATVFDSSDGVRILGLGGSLTPQVSKSPDGKLFFTPTDGVSIIDPPKLVINKLPPPVHIEQITADRKPYDLSAGLRLPALIRDLQIDYTALSFAAPEKVQFRYMLEGHDTDWQDVGPRRQAFYNDLPPRHYRFRVIACNNSGVWNEAGASFDFSIAPAYYQTPWFLVSCVAAFLALLWGLYRLRLRQVAWQFNMRMEERVAERTRIARDFHDTLLQSFHGVLLMLSVVTRRIKDPPEARQQLEAIVEQARKAVVEGRDAVQGLRSSTSITNDLAHAIRTLGEELAAGQSAQNCPEFRVQVEGASRDLAPLVRDDVHRIACEAVRNAFRHGQAGKIEVEILYERLQLRLRVLDNGKGFDRGVLADGGRPGHFGLAGMRERAQLVGGELTVSSSPDSGTQIELTVPASHAYSKSLPASPPLSSGEGT